MLMTAEKLLALWRNRNEIFSSDDSRYIVDRFDELYRLFAEIGSCDVKIAGNIYVDGEELTFRNGGKISTCYFSCKEDEMTAGGAFRGVKIQADNLPEKYTGLIYRIGCMMGGFDFVHNYHMVDEYRIISNAITSRHDNGSLSSGGEYRHPSSNFADNNYFFNVVLTVNEIRNGTFSPDSSRLNLRWPHSKYYPDGDAKAEISQRETLRYRFPYKFFYMWTHSDVVRLASLWCYKELVNQADKNLRYAADCGLSQSYEDFVAAWKDYSDKIRDIIPENERGSDFWREMSKLLSIVMLQNRSIRNLREVLETGNKAVILYGPPGTGKTYTAEKLVCQMLGVAGDKIDAFRFQANRNDKVYENGAWTMVQFHPNYGYEDFIGGISPELTGTTLGYRLKTGVFKRFCDEAAKPEHMECNFVFVIDEINRADLSAVFGELLYGLEYRGREMEIPNFDEPFVIPDNVYIIGTMNSIDKSLVTFDLALRRRFAFYKVMPDLRVLEDMLTGYNVTADVTDAFIKRCRALNDALTDARALRLGEDYRIGHAYYGKICDFLDRRAADEDTQLITSVALEKLWEYHLEPLILEYIGNRIDDAGVIRRIEELKKEFIKPL